MEILLLIIIVLLIAVVGFLVWRLQSGGQGSNDLQQILQQSVQQQGIQLQQNTQLLLQQLNSHKESQDRSTYQVSNRLEHATKVVSEVQGKLMQLEEANKRMYDLGKDISGLQNILKSPKLRGGMGEIWLAEMLAQVIPSGQFKMQYRFKSGEICDAVITLRDGMLLPIDSKFSLENFVKMTDGEDTEKAAFKKLFHQDMKKRIDEIAKKYILPDEGTLDFAFMYVPAENVYYQAFIQDEDKLNMLDYAMNKHVIPVSPSSFYAYLQVIAMGLRGLEIEKSAKEIQKNLGGVKGELGKFREAYDTLGRHLHNAKQSFDNSDKRLSGVEGKFAQIAERERTLTEPTEPIISLSDANE